MPSLNEKLFKIFDDGLGKVKRPHNIREYDMMIRYGSLGEVTDDYYLFIYRDLYRSPAYYGAILFFNKLDRSGRPVTITCIEETGDERERQIYIYAAIHFLKNNYTNLIKLNGKVELVFDMAKKRINKFLEGKGSIKTQRIEDFKYNITDQKIEAIEQKTENSDILGKNIPDKDIEKILALTQYKEDDRLETEIKGTVGVALSLVETGNLLEKKTLNFMPIVISKKKHTLLPKQRYHKILTSYHLDQKNKTLINFLELYCLLSKNDLSNNKNIAVVNELYFDQIATKLFEGNLNKSFYIINNIKAEFFNLKTGIFKKIEVKFAPSLVKNNSFSVFIDFILENGVTLSGKDNYRIRIFNNSVYIYIYNSEGDHYLIKPRTNKNFINFFKFIKRQNKFHIDSLNSLISALEKIKTEQIQINTELIKKYTFKFLPTPVLKIIKEEGKNSLGNKIIIEFDYIESIKPYLKNNPDKELFFYEKNKDFEKECFSVIENDNELIKELSYDNYNQSIIPNFHFKDNNPLKWLISQGDKYLKRGFKIYSNEQKKFIGNINGEFSINMRTGIDWLEFSPDITNSISGKRLHIDHIVDEENGLISDKKGDLHLITKKQIQKLKDLFDYGEKSGNFYKIPSANFILINKLYDERMNDIIEIKDILLNNKRILNFDRIKEYSLSYNFNGELRTYQKAGFDWLNFLREYNFSGCLADDMGLGKTVQTIAFLQTLKDNKNFNTSILIVPVSAISNWESEIVKFSKNINFINHIGIKRTRTSKDWAKYDLVITSYATLRNDIEIFKEFNFEYIILDESQNIKNHTSQVSKAVKLIKGKYRLALSGTPIENSSFELWSLFDYLMPGYLGSIKWFKDKFSKQNGNSFESSKTERIELLKKMIFPFLLRRKKEEVEKDLPPKTEIIIKLKMNGDQQAAYEATAQKYRNELELEKETQSDKKNNAIKVLEGILRLRQICLFPELANNNYKDIPSAKFEYFKEQIKEILAEGHKVLIFSQFTKVLSILKNNIEKENIAYSYLDGSTSIAKRKDAIERFQETEETSVFLLSLKAGGVAINLTKADYVIIFDPWWNPAVEAQAIDRSHRIGQTKNVIVYKMVLENTIEEKMLKLQEKKKDLFENIITTDSRSFKDLSKKELLNLFK